MLLKLKNSEDLIKVADVDNLVNPAQKVVQGKDQMGQEEQDLADYSKTELSFPSGEDLPRCWYDPDYHTHR